MRSDTLKDRRLASLIEAVKKKKNFPDNNPRSEVDGGRFSAAERVVASAILQGREVVNDQNLELIEISNEKSPPELKAWALQLRDYLTGDYLAKVNFLEGDTVITDWHPFNFNFYPQGPKQVLVNSAGDAVYALVGKVGQHYVTKEEMGGEGVLVYEFADDCLTEVSYRKARELGFKVKYSAGSAMSSRIAALAQERPAAGHRSISSGKQPKTMRTSDGRPWAAACVGKPEAPKRKQTQRVKKDEKARAASGSHSNFRFKTLHRDRVEPGDRVRVKRF